MGLYHKEWFTLVVKGLTPVREGVGSTLGCAIYFATAACQVGPTRGTACQAGPTGGTRVPGRTNGWDPGVRPDRWVGPGCQIGPMDGTQLSDRRVGPGCQVEPMCKDRLTGGTL
jgi:hypothetical protein